MIIKIADDHRPQIATLEVLVDRREFAQAIRRIIALQCVAGTT